MPDFLSSVLKGVLIGDQLQRQSQDMDLRRQEADQRQQSFDLQKKRLEDENATRDAEKQFAKEAVDIQGRIGKENSAELGPPEPTLTEEGAFDKMAKSASRLGLSSHALDLATKAGIKRDQHRLMGAVLAGDLNPMFERLGGMGIKAEEGQDPQTGKPFITVTRKDGSTKVMPFESRDHMLGSMASLLDGKYADFALNMAKSGMSQDTAMQRLYMNSLLQGGELNRKIAETNARLDGTLGGGRGTGSTRSHKAGGEAANDEYAALYGPGIKDRKDVDDMLRARVPDDAQVNLWHDKVAGSSVSAPEFRARIADHLGALAQGAQGAKTVEDMLPVAQELARRDFVEKLAGKQDPDGVYLRETEYDGKTGQWRQKLVTPEGRTFYYGRPGVDPTRFGLTPEKLELANFQKASSEYETLVALTKPENKAAMRRALAEQFSGSEDEFRGALEVARGRVQQMQAKREADASLRREASRAKVMAPGAAAKPANAAFSPDQIAAAAALGVESPGKPARIDEMAKEAWNSAKGAMTGTYFTMNEALFDRNLREVRETGGMRIGNADALRRAISGQPELKALLSPAEVSALEVATGRKLP